LKCLECPEIKELPFEEHFLSLELQTIEPGYLEKRKLKDAYNLEYAFLRIENCLARSILHILQKWLEWNSTLDKS